MKRSLALLFAHLALLKRVDQAQAFQVGGISATKPTESTAFSRPLSAPRSESMATIRPQKSFSSESQLNAVMDIVGVSPEPIHTAFAYATFGPQPFWLLMILLPGNELTKKIMGKMGKEMDVSLRIG